MKFVVALVLGLMSAVAVHAQDFPNKPVRLIVGSAAGGPVDTAARVVGERLADLWKQPVTVENRVGGSEMIGTEFVLKSAPDGYTLLMVSLNPFMINPVVFPKIPYDAEKGFTPISLTTRNPMVLVAGVKTPFNNVKEMIEAAKARPGSLNYSSPGLATTNHISAEWFASEAGIQLFHVPYKGGPAAANAVLAGDVPLGLVSLVQALPLAKEGKLKALAVTTRERTQLAPDMPTLHEQGITNFDSAVRAALFGPAGLPRNIVTKINTDVNAVLRAPETRQRFAAMGVDPSGSTPEELDNIIRTGRAQIARIVERAKIKVEQ